MLTLAAIEAKLDLIRLQYRGYSAVGCLAMHGTRPATPAEMVGLRRDMARYEKLIRASDQMRLSTN